MKNDNTKTFMAKKEEMKPQWFLFDATGKTLGRLATEIAKVLRGKHSPAYTPHVDTGDGVIVINVEKIEVTGAKEAQKVYHDYTGNIGGLRLTSYKTMKERHPDRILQRAVKGMVPRTKLGRAQMKKLRLFIGSEHDMQAQQPIAVQ